MKEFDPVLFNEVAAVLRKAALRGRRPLLTRPARAMPDYTPGFWLVQDGPTQVTVYWSGRGERYRLERLDRAAEALESAGFGVGRFADAPRFWLEVFRRSEKPSETISRVVGLIGVRADDPQAQKRGDQAWMRVLAEWLQGHADDLVSAGGRFSSCDSPGDVQVALRLARAYLGEEAADGR